ncbi:MAG: hypothetical protein ACO1NS_10665 [Daejeonella sp.]|uniref:hypothetical protein n=1 Tax=Daejeonella sp. JGW-45 TaxID=3034148 RepID=UPI0023EC865E|nr:hypothetical protein [Daejeonella sp. JGW-45]
MTSKFAFNPFVLFPLNIAVLFLLVYTADTFILNANFYEQAVANSGLNWETVLLNTSPKLKLLLYTASVLLLLLKYSLIALLIYTTFYLNEIKVSYQSIFRIVCLAELVFLIPAAIKVAWFIIYPPTGLDQWAAFYPLSIHSVFSGSSIPAAITYPLQLLNAFELIYILMLSYLFYKLLKNDFDQMIKIVLISYLPGLFVWTLIASYFTVMLNPS